MNVTQSIMRSPLSVCDCLSSRKLRIPFVVLASINFIFCSIYKCDCLEVCVTYLKFSKCMNLSHSHHMRLMCGCGLVTELSLRPRIYLLVRLLDMK